MVSGLELPGFRLGRVFGYYGPVPFLVSLGPFLRVVTALRTEYRRNNGPAGRACLSELLPGRGRLLSPLRLGVSLGGSLLTGTCPDEGEVHKNSLGHELELHLAASVAEISRSPNEG